MRLKLCRVLSTAVGVLVLAGATSHAAEKTKSKLYKWVDDKGVTHYSETMPVEAKDRSSTEIDKRGRVLRKQDAALTQEQLDQIEAEKERKKLDEKRAEIQRRKDNALLNTYTTEGEIDSARERSIGGAKQSLLAIEARLKTARTKLDNAQKASAAAQKSGQPVPENVKDEVVNGQRELAKIEKEYQGKQAEIETLRQKYDADKKRFQELMSALKKP